MKQKNLTLKPRPLDIKFKQKFREYLNKDKKIEYHNIKLYNNEFKYKFKVGIGVYGNLIC